MNNEHIPPNLDPLSPILGDRNPWGGVWLPNFGGSGGGGREAKADPTQPNLGPPSPTSGDRRPKAGGERGGRPIADWAHRRGALGRGPAVAGNKRQKKEGSKTRQQWKGSGGIPLKNPGRSGEEPVLGDCGGGGGRWLPSPHGPWCCTPRHHVAPENLWGVPQGCFGVARTERGASLQEGKQTEKQQQSDRGGGVYPSSARGGHLSGRRDDPHSTQDKGQGVGKGPLAIVPPTSGGGSSLPSSGGTHRYLLFFGLLYGVRDLT